MRASPLASDWAMERLLSSSLMAFVFASELKRRARKAPSWDATWAVGALGGVVLVDVSMT